MLVTNSLELRKLCSQIEEESYIAVDTEFMRNKTYYPVPCLLQIAFSKGAFALDLINKIDLEPIKQILANRKIKKVFHSCKQDLEVLKIVFGQLPSSIFDTQIAAQFLGFEITPSYDKLVKKYLDITVSKAMQFSNWEARPLSNQHIKYAVDDVVYLHKIYEIMRKELSAKKYIAWASEEFKKAESLVNTPAIAEDSLKKYYYHFKEKEELAKCFMLLKWREDKASQTNVPKSTILNDDHLYNLLLRKNAKSNNPEVAKILSATPSAQAYDIASKLIAKNKKRQKPNAKTLAELKVLLRKISEEYSISASLIANSETLQTLASNKKRGLKINNGWRKKIFGRLALSLIKGDIKVSEIDDKIIITKINE